MILISKNLTFLRKGKGLKQAELAEELDLRPTTYAHYETGKSSPSLEMLETLSNYFRVPVDNLLFKDLSLGKEDLIEEPETAYEIKKSGIPLVSVDAFAGTGNAVFKIQQKDILAFYDIPEFRMADFLTRIKGDSMEDTYSSGDIIACKIIHDRSFIQWNKPHVIATKSQGIITKRLKKGKKDKTYICISDNKEYDPFEIPDSEIDDLAIVLGGVWVE